MYTGTSAFINEQQKQVNSPYVNITVDQSGGGASFQMTLLDNPAGVNYFTLLRDNANIEVSFGASYVYLLGNPLSASVLSDSCYIFDVIGMSSLLNAGTSPPLFMYGIKTTGHTYVYTDPHGGRKGYDIYIGSSYVHLYRVNASLSTSFQITEQHTNFDGSSMTGISVVLGSSVPNSNVASYISPIPFLKRAGNDIYMTYFHSYPGSSSYIDMYVSRYNGSSYIAPEELGTPYIPSVLGSSNSYQDGNLDNFLKAFQIGSKVMFLAYKKEYVDTNNITYKHVIDYGVVGNRSLTTLGRLWTSSNITSDHPYFPVDISIYNDGISNVSAAFLWQRYRSTDFWGLFSGSGGTMQQINADTFAAKFTFSPDYKITKKDVFIKTSTALGFSTVYSTGVGRNNYWDYTNGSTLDIVLGSPLFQEVIHRLDVSSNYNQNPVPGRITGSTTPTSLNLIRYANSNNSSFNFEVANTNAA